MTHRERKKITFINYSQLNQHNAANGTKIYANALQFSEKKDFIFILSEMQILGDLFPRDNFGDFFPTHSSLNSMSLESEQLQLSVYEIMGFTHTSSGKRK